MIRRPPRSTLFPTRRSSDLDPVLLEVGVEILGSELDLARLGRDADYVRAGRTEWKTEQARAIRSARSEEHTSELQSRLHLVCRLLLEKKKKRLSQRTQSHRC